MFESEISRSKFIKLIAKFAAVFFVGSQTINCSRDGIPPLKGISESDYEGFVGIQKVFLDGNPVQDFDLGVALDNYIYGHPYPIETEDLIRFLAMVPSSTAIALFLDFSLTPLSSLDKDSMEKRLLSWKTSSLALKRGLYSILRQFSFFLLSSDKKFQQFMSYNS
ncbi:MAG: hypothetical protein JJT78_10935 [Leptospira sp.]|nr:hypothetical protein [Leptospira sp.]